MKLVLGFSIVFFLLCPQKSFEQDSTSAVVKNWINLKTQLQRKANLATSLAIMVEGSKTMERQKIAQLKMAAADLFKFLDTLKQFDSLAIAAASDRNRSLDESLTETTALAEKDAKLKKRNDMTALIAQLEGAENRVTVARYDYNENCKTFNRPDLLFRTNDVTRQTKIEF